MNLGTIVVITIIAIALAFAIRSIARSGGHSCSGCASCGSCSSCTGAGAAGCPSCDAAQKMIDAVQEKLDEER